MWTLKKKFKAGGFSLVEVVIGMGMMAAGSLVVMNLKQSFEDATVQITRENEVDRMHKEIISLVDTKSACDQTFTGVDLNVANTAIVNIRNTAGTSMFCSNPAGGACYNTHRTKISSMTLSTPVLISNRTKPNPPGAPVIVNKWYRANLRVVFLSKSTATANTKEVVKNIPVNIMTNPGNVSIGCEDDQSIVEKQAREQACEALGGTLDDTIGSGELSCRREKSGTYEKLKVELCDNIGGVYVSGTCRKKYWNTTCTNGVKRITPTGTLECL